MSDKTNDIGRGIPYTGTYEYTQPSEDFWKVEKTNRWYDNKTNWDIRPIDVNYLYNKHLETKHSLECTQLWLVWVICFFGLWCLYLTLSRRVSAKNKTQTKTKKPKRQYGK